LKDPAASRATEIQGFLGKGRSEASLAKGKTAEVAGLLREGHSVFSRAHPNQRDNKPDGFV
jgi:hypothetical protein